MRVDLEEEMKRICYLKISDKITLLTKFQKNFRKRARYGMEWNGKGSYETRKAQTKGVELFLTIALN